MPTPIAVSDFDTLFAEAVAAVPEEYIRVPIADSAPVIRERAFAYELYHRLRLTNATTGYTLNGELEKAAHPDMDDQKVKRLAPDLLLHTPGNRRGNFVAIEIKGGKPRNSGFRKDLGSLSYLRDRFQYQRLIYLLYGVSREQARNVALAMKRVNRLRPYPADLRRIELWVRYADSQDVDSLDWSA